MSRRSDTITHLDALSDLSRLRRRGVRFTEREFSSVFGYTDFYEAAKNLANEHQAYNLISRAEGKVEITGLGLEYLELRSEQLELQVAISRPEFQEGWLAISKGEPFSKEDFPEDLWDPFCIASESLGFLRGDQWDMERLAMAVRADFDYQVLAGNGGKAPDASNSDLGVEILFDPDKVGPFPEFQLRAVLVDVVDDVPPTTLRLTSACITLKRILTPPEAMAAFRFIAGVFKDGERH